MIPLKVHSKRFNEYTDIDKFILLPKKMWNDVELGENSFIINGKHISLRVYDVPCECTGEMHSHRLIDLRESWDDLSLKADQEVMLDK